MRIAAPSTILFCLIAWTGAVLAETTPPAALKSGQLTAGSELRFEFPELPPTLYEMDKGEKVVPAFTARLPDNYMHDGKFPLFVYLDGGSGAKPGSPSRSVAVAGQRNFIAVSLPLFKRGPFDRQKPAAGLLLEADDCQTMARAYRAMLTVLLLAVPNVDVGHGVLGGFSNGAHATALLISDADEFTLRQFERFYFVEGGGRISHLGQPALREKHFLSLINDKIRPSRLAEMKEEAQRNRLDWKHVMMPGSGHAFPPEYYDTVRNWALRQPVVAP